MQGVAALRSPPLFTGTLRATKWQHQSLAVDARSCHHFRRSRIGQTDLRIITLQAEFQRSANSHHEVDRGP